MSMPFEPWDEIACPSLESASAVLLGLPYDGAVCARRGASQAPARIRMLSGLPTRFNEEGLCPHRFQLFDAGDLFPDASASAPQSPRQYFQAVEERALALLGSGRFCLFLGGDHSVSIPLIRAFSRAFAGKKIGLLHFDAHPDLLESYDGRTWSHACTQRRSLELAGLTAGDLALLGVRSFMAEEVAFLENHPEIKVFRARDIYRRGPQAVAEEVIAHFRGFDSLYLTIDIDVLDPAHAPGTGTPDAGGLSTRELLELVCAVAAELPVKAADVVEVSPPLDSSDITSLAALKVIYELLGAVLLRQEKVSPGFP